MPAVEGDIQIGALHRLSVDSDKTEVLCNILR